tara:strand:- start:3134 stop:3946 length:813 start_codon:yes stop_codon:yes gene_type:complete
MYSKQQLEAERQRQLAATSQDKDKNNPGYYKAFNKRFLNEEPIPPAFVDDNCPINTEKILLALENLDDPNWKIRNPLLEHRKVMYNEEDVIHCKPEEIPDKPGFYDIGDGYLYSLKEASGVWSRYDKDNVMDGFITVAEPDIKSWKTYACPYKNTIIEEAKKWTESVGVEKWKVDFQKMPKNGLLQVHMDSTYWFTFCYAIQLKHPTPVVFHSCKNPKYSGEYLYKKAALMNITEEWHSVNNHDDKERMIMRIHGRDKSYREIYKQMSCK